MYFKVERIISVILFIVNILLVFFLGKFLLFLLDSMWLEFNFWVILDLLFLILF